MRTNAFTPRSVADALHLPVTDAWLADQRSKGHLPEASISSKEALAKAILVHFLSSDLRQIGTTRLGSLQVTLQVLSISLHGRETKAASRALR